MGDSKTCAREGCDNPLKTGRIYCSTDCANKVNAEKRTKSPPDSVQFEGQLEVVRSGVLPHEFENALISALGHDRASAVLVEIEEMVQEQVNLGTFPDWLRTRYPIGPTMMPGLSVPRPSLKPPLEQKFEPDTDLRPYFDSGGTNSYLADFRRDNNITYADIDRLLRLGPCVLAARLKQGPIMSALSGKRKWSLISPSTSTNKLKLVMEADLERLFLRNVHHILTSLEYGVAFGSTVWAKKTAENIGVESGVGGSSRWWVVDKIEWAHPSTVPTILRDKNMSFAGFVHRRKNLDPRDVTVDPMQALVIPYMSRFGNMWGQTMFEQSYDFAYWYEVVMRSFLRFLNRMATPVAVAYGPNRGRSVRPDGTTISNPQYGLLLAGAAAFSSAIYVPSERDIQTGQPLWRLEYLDTNQKGDQFISALQYLGTQILRASLVGDRSFTQTSGETGSYNASEMHNKLQQIDNDFIFKSILGYMNDYLIRRYAMFNVDYNNPPAMRLRAEVIDPDEQEVLMKLFATAGNIKLFDGTPLDRVDWEEAFHSINVPVLADDEFEALYKEHQERKKENQEMFQEVQSKAAQNNQQPFGRNGGNQQQQQQQEKKPDRDKDARLSVLEHLVDGGAVPVLLTPEQAGKLALPEREENLDTVELQSRGRRPRPTRDQATDPEFEKQHPRDETGKFAKKEEEGEEEEGEDGDRELAWEEFEWVAMDGVVHNMRKTEIDGVQYYAEADVADEDVIAMHEQAKRIMENGSELYGEQLRMPVVIIGASDEKTRFANGAMIPNPFSGKANDPAIVVSDFGAGSAESEMVMAHEIFHAQTRINDYLGEVTYEEALDGGVYANYPLMAEEAFNGIIANGAYAERYLGLPATRFGWDDAVSAVAQAANVNGWSKDKLYDFAIRAHKIDGTQYKNIVEAMFRGTGLELRGYPDALQEYWPGSDVFGNYDPSTSSWGSMYQGWDIE